MLQKSQPRPTRFWTFQRFAAVTVLGPFLVWLAGAVWSYQEQSDAADRMHFAQPWLLPITVDGLFISLAIVSFMASLDARPATAARLLSFVALAGSSASNAVGTAERVRTATGDGFVPNAMHGFAVVVAALIPLAAFLAFEVLLGELRRQVQRARGLPAPTPIPQVRLVRLLLSPMTAFSEWRTEVIRVTAPDYRGAPEECTAPEPVEVHAAGEPQVRVGAPPASAPLPGQVALPTAPSPTPAVGPGEPQEHCEGHAEIADLGVEVHLSGERGGGEVILIDPVDRDQPLTGRELEVARKIDKDPELISGRKIKTAHQVGTESAARISRAVKYSRSQRVMSTSEEA